MSMAFYRHRIHCPQCHYEGNAKVKGTGGGLALFGLAVLILGYWFPPLIIVSVLFFLVAIFKPAKQICPECKWAYPVPRTHWEQRNDEKKACPFCAEPIRKEAIKCKHCGSDIPGSTNERDIVNFQKPDDSYKNTLSYKTGRLWKRMSRTRKEG
jgi:LITAF-like zinc ribbon domain